LDSDSEVFDRTDPDAEICRPDLCDRCSKSDDGQVNANVGSDDSAINDDGGVYSGGHKDEDNNNDDWAHWDENDPDLYTSTIAFRASSGYKPPRNGKMPASPHKFLYYFWCNFV
jgi:hypothetical protein